MQLRPFLGIAASAAIALLTYACSDTTFPSQLPVYTPLDGSAVGLTDTGAPVQPVSEGGVTPTDAGDSGARMDAGDATSHADAGDAGDAGPGVDGGDSGETDAGDSGVTDASDDAG